MMKIHQFIEKHREFEIIEYSKKRMCCVYFICDQSDTIIYVGSTVNLCLSIEGHQSQVRFAGKSVYYILCRNKIECRKLEIKFIKLLDTEYNAANAYWSKYEAFRRERRLWESEKIRLLRMMAEQKMTQSDVAKKRGISRQRVSQILKSHKTKVATFQKMQDAIDPRKN